MLVSLTNKKLLLLLHSNLFPDSVKVIDYLPCSVIAISSNLCVQPSLRTEIFFYLLPTCIGELLSTPKAMAILLQLPSGNENCERASKSKP